MEPIIKIENLKYKEFKDFNMCINKNSYLTILGGYRSGKTTLTKLICKIIDSENIKIDSKYKIIGVFSPKNTPFLSKKVYDELLLSSITLENKKSIIDDVIDIFKLNFMLDKKINKLTNSEKQILIIACAVLMKPDVLVIDNSLSNIDYFYKKDILKALKKINKKYKITIINFTNDSEDTIYGTDIAIINNGKLVLNNKKNEILKDENNFIKNDFKIPFIVDLSTKLKYYNLIKKVVLKKEELVEEIWG